MVWACLFDPEKDIQDKGIHANREESIMRKKELPLPVTYAHVDYSEWYTHDLPDEDMDTEKYHIGMGESTVDFYLTWVIGEGDQSVLIDAAYLSGHQVISGDHGNYQGLLITYSRTSPPPADASSSWADDL